MNTNKKINFTLSAKNIKEIKNILKSVKMGCYDDVYFEGKNKKLIINFMNCFIFSEDRDNIDNFIFEQTFQNVKDVFNSLQEKEILFTLENNTLSFEANEIVVATENTGISDINFDNIEKLNIPTCEVFNALKTNASYVSKETFRPVLQGVYFHFEEKELKIVSTDGRQMLIQKIELEENIKTENSFILGTYFIKSLSKLENDKELFLCKNKNNIEYILIKCGSFSFYQKAIEVKYPNYKQVIPKTYNETENKENIFGVSFNPLHALGSLKNIKHIVKELRNKRVFLRLENNKMSFIANSDVAIAGVFIQAEHKAENKTLFAFNYDYLLNLFSVFSDREKIELTLYNDTTPVVVKEENKTAILMLQNIEETEDMKEKLYSFETAQLVITAKAIKKCKADKKVKTEKVESSEDNIKIKTAKKIEVYFESEIENNVSLEELEEYIKNILIEKLKAKNTEIITAEKSTEKTNNEKEKDNTCIEKYQSDEHKNIDTNARENIKETVTNTNIKRRESIYKDVPLKVS